MEYWLILGVTFSILLLTSLIKMLLPREKFENYYVFVPGILGLILALVLSDPFLFKEIFKNVLIFAGIPSYLYKTGKSGLALLGLKK